jgi:hypothetical protein
MVIANLAAPVGRGHYLVNVLVYSALWGAFSFMSRKYGGIMAQIGYASTIGVFWVWGWSAHRRMLRTKVRQWGLALIAVVLLPVIIWVIRDKSIDISLALFLYVFTVQFPVMAAGKWPRSD